MEMRSKWSDMFVQQGLDAIIFPALPLPALPHGIPGKLTAAFSNMFIANLLQWPCGVVPVTTVRENEQFYKEAPNDDYCKMAHQVMQNSAGLPMSVQVMAPAFQDEKCLRIMKEVETLAGFTAKPMAYKKEKEAKTVRV
jgi:fatty acid amide hydrolase